MGILGRIQRRIRHDFRKKTLQSKEGVKTEAYEDANGEAEFEKQFQHNRRTPPDRSPSIAKWMEK